RVDLTVDDHIRPMASAGGTTGAARRVALGAVGLAGDFNTRLVDRSDAPGLATLERIRDASQRRAAVRREAVRFGVERRNLACARDTLGHALLLTADELHARL